jgi:hypothetical protein
VAGSELVFPVRRLAPDGLEAWKRVVESGTKVTAKNQAGVRRRAPSTPAPKYTEVPCEFRIDLGQQTTGFFYGDQVDQGTAVQCRAPRHDQRSGEPTNNR